MSAQPEALRLAEVLDLLAMDMKTPRQAAAELRRLHEQNTDYANTIDGLIISSCDDMARIVRLEDLRDELMAALRAVTNHLDEGCRNTSDLEVVWAAQNVIAKAEGDIDASR